MANIHGVIAKNNYEQSRRSNYKEGNAIMSSSITVLLPIFFVLALGYIAGRAKQFNSEQASGLNELVLSSST